MGKRLLPLAVTTAALLSGCGQAEEMPAETFESVAAKLAEPAPAPEVEAGPPLADADLGRLCKATIAMLMGKDVAIMKVEKVEEGAAYVAYNRLDDGTLWRNRCKTQGSKVIWGGVDVDGPGSGPGRWRDDPQDETLTFTLGENNSIIIAQKFPDGSGNSETYVVD